MGTASGPPALWARLAGRRRTSRDRGRVDSAAKTCAPYPRSGCKRARACRDCRPARGDVEDEKPGISRRGSLPVSPDEMALAGIRASREFLGVVGPYRPHRQNSGHGPAAAADLASGLVDAATEL